MATVRQNNVGIPLVVVDDHAVMRDAICALLAQYENMRVVACASSPAEAAKAIAEHSGAVVIFDLAYKKALALEAISDLVTRFPSCRVLVVSMLDEAAYIEAALARGARGYLMKEAAPDQLAEAVRRVAAGEIYASLRMRAMLPQVASTSQVSRRLESLTPREWEVFRLEGALLSSREIAARLGISVKTVESHRESIKNKLVVSTLEELRGMARKIVAEASP